MSRVTKCDWCKTEKAKGQVWPLWFQLSYLPPPFSSDAIWGIEGGMVENDACSPHCLQELSAAAIEKINERRARKGD